MNIGSNRRVLANLFLAALFVLITIIPLCLYLDNIIKTVVLNNMTDYLIVNAVCQKHVCTVDHQRGFVGMIGICASAILYHIYLIILIFRSQVVSAKLKNVETPFFNPISRRGIIATILCSIFWIYLLLFSPEFGSGSTSTHSLNSMGYLAYYLFSVSLISSFNIVFTFVFVQIGDRRE
jgi:hypothetical protein